MFTVTTVVVCAVQPNISVPIIVYVEVITGLAVTEVPVVPLNPPGGAHV